MKYKINLINVRKEKFYDRIIYFALHYLRYILVITQIIVIGVFFYRFKVDQEIVDLQDSIDQKKEIIQISQPLIKEAKNSAFKLKTIETILSDQQRFLDATDYILSLFPDKFSLKKLDISKDTITMNGLSQDPETIQRFLNRLKKEARFKKVNLANIQKTDQGLEFSFEFNTFNKTKSL